jgi:hypothetical protein
VRGTVSLTAPGLESPANAGVRENRGKRIPGGDLLPLPGLPAPAVVRAAGAAARGQLADDVGRLRRHLAAIVDDYEDTYTAHLVERIACHVEVLHGFERMTAGERVAAGVPVDEALAEVDREATVLRRRLGPRPRRKSR